MGVPYPAGGSTAVRRNKHDIQKANLALLGPATLFSSYISTSLEYGAQIRQLDVFCAYFNLMDLSRCLEETAWEHMFQCSHAEQNLIDISGFNNTMSAIVDIFKVPTEVDGGSSACATDLELASANNNISHYEPLTQYDDAAMQEQNGHYVPYLGFDTFNQRMWNSYDASASPLLDGIATISGTANATMSWPSEATGGPTNIEDRLYLVEQSLQSTSTSYSDMDIVEMATHTSPSNERHSIVTPPLTPETHGYGMPAEN